MAAPSLRNPPSRKNKPARSLRARALALLARREYSRQELARRLAFFTEDPAEISGLLEDFERRGWLSEERVVEQVVASRRRRFGASRIAHELREKGIPDAMIVDACAKLRPSEVEAARDVRRRKFKAAPADARERARHMRFLQGRGFSLDVIRKVIRGDGDD